MAKNGQVQDSVHGPRSEAARVSPRASIRLKFHRERILDTWELRVRQAMPATRAMNSQELRQSFPELVDQIIFALEEEDVHEYLTKHDQATGRKHGQERSQSASYDLNEMIEEYQILRRVLLEVLREEGPLSDHETDLILDAVTMDVRHATSEFLEQRKKEDLSLKSELKESEERFRIVVEGVNDHAIIRTDLNGVIVDWNSGAEKILGYSRQEAVGKNASMIFKSEDLAIGAHLQEMKLARETGRAEDNRWHVRKDGSLFYAVGAMNPLKDYQGNIKGYVKVFRDFTRQHEATVELKRAKESLEFALEASGMGCWDFSYLSDDATRSLRHDQIYGYDRPLKAWNFDQFYAHIIPEDRALAKQKFDDLAKTGEIEFDYRIRRIDGEIRWIHLNGRGYKDDDGKVIRVAGLLKDITVEKQAFEAQRESEARARRIANNLARAKSELEEKTNWLETILEQIPTAIVFAEAPTGKLLFANKQVKKVWRQEFFPSEKMEEYGIYTAFHADGRRYSGEDWPVSRAIKNGEVIRNEDTDVLLGDGTRGILRISAAPIRKKNGEIAGAVVISEDVTKQELARKELELSEARYREAKHLAEAASSAKSSFLANMSHEIRTPMTAVLGFTELLKDSDLSFEERMDSLTRIENSGRALLRLIDDILDISKIEAGKFDIHKSVFSPISVVSDVVAMMRIAAERKGLHLKYKTQLHFPSTVYCDPARLRQIVVNLVGNAIKFTESGDVVVTLKTENNEFLIVEVCDTGIGISPNDQAKLFQPFAQADESISRTFGGSGLGLMLSQRLAEKMGGGLWLSQSEAGKGSVFIVKIHSAPFQFDDAIEPQPDRTSHRPASTDDKALAGIRVLVAEDVVDNRVLMKRYLTRAGATAEFAVNGAEAIEKALSGNFDLILMDIQMPEVDGLQATKELRAQGYHKPIVALTAHAMAEESERSFEAGCDEHITKPITNSLLVKTVLKFVTKH